MALRAVDLHGGMLTVDSKVNAGTVVKIRLPAESAA
jgi:signal transduction histidine kinase